MKRVLIIGGSGTIGRALTRELTKDKNLEVYGTYYKGRTDLSEDKSLHLDLDNLTAFMKRVSEINPACILSATRGDFDKQLKLHRELAEYLAKTKGTMYYCSTANVFDRDSTRPHYEGDGCEAESEYGQFKAQCERALTGILGEQMGIFRFCQVWSQKSYRIKKLFKELNGDEDIEIYDNVYQNRTTDTLLAKQMTYILQKGLTGIFHLGASDMISERTFMTELINQLGYENAKIKWIQLPGEKYIQAVLSQKDIFPEDLIFTHTDMIKELTEGRKSP